jgi:hypothetical protein
MLGMTINIFIVLAAATFGSALLYTRTWRTPTALRRWARKDRIDMLVHGQCMRRYRRGLIWLRVMEGGHGWRGRRSRGQHAQRDRGRRVQG